MRCYLLAIVNRWYQILQLLIVRKRVHLEELSQLIQASVQTTKKSIELLNQEIYGIANITLIKGLVELQIIDHDLFLEIMNGTLKNELDFNSATKRISYILKRLLDTEEYLLIDDLSEELKISRGTVNNDIKQLKQLIADFDVHLTGVPNKGLMLEGTEFNLRLLYLYHVYDFFGHPTILTHEMNKIIEKLSATEQLNRININLLKKVLDITITRMRHKRFIEEKILHYTNCTRENPLIENLFFQLETVFQLTLGQYERDFISFPIMITTTGFVRKQFINDRALAKIFQSMMRVIHRNFVLDIDDAQLFNEMKYHLLFLINRMIFHLETTDLFFNEIENNYPFPYELARVGITEIGRLIQRQPSTIEISYLAIYFELILRQTKNEPKKKIAIICSTGRGTTALINRQIKSILGTEIEIDPFSEYEYPHANLNDYFAIFTTVPLKEAPFGIPIVRITNIFDDKWLKTEWGRLHNLQRLDHRSFTIRFEKLSSQRSYLHHLKQITERLLHEKLIDNLFQERIFKREKKQTTIFNNGIAFPHEINNQISTILFYLGVLDQPIQTKNGEIQFVFLIGIPESMDEKSEQDLLKLYDTILKMFATKTIRTEILQLNSQDEFLALIKRKDWLL